MKKNILLVLVFYALALVATIALWPKLPETVPIHWNIRGEVDNHGPKSMLLILLHLPLAITFLMALAPKLDPKKENYEKHDRPYSIIMLSIPLFLFFLYAIVLAKTGGLSINIQKIVPITIALLLIIIGNQMPRFRFNYFVGIKTPWTLANEEVWKQTHRVGGYTMTITGVISVILFSLPWTLSTAIGLGVLIIGPLLPIPLSYLMYRKIE